MKQRGFTSLIYRRVLVSNLLVRADVSEAVLTIRLFPPVRVLLDGLVPNPVVVRADEVERVIVARRFALNAVLVPTPEAEWPAIMVSRWVAEALRPDLTEQAKRVGRFEAVRFVRGPLWP